MQGVKKGRVLMKDITIYSSNEDWFMPIASAPGEFQIHLTAQPSVTGGTDCVLISQQYAGNQISSAIAQLKELHIPCAVVTYDNTVENQSYLLGCGADDVFILPMCVELMRRRIHALTDLQVQSAGGLSFAAFDRITESNSGTGAFVVAEHDFISIYRFVARLLERLDQRAQLIFFRITNEDGPFAEADSVLHFLKIVQASLRRGDICCVAGSQIMMILMGSDAAGGHLVINRITGAFNAHYNMDESCEVSCQMREINKDSSKPAIG